LRNRKEWIVYQQALLAVNITGEDEDEEEVIPEVVGEADVAGATRRRRRCGFVVLRIDDRFLTLLCAVTSDEEERRCITEDRVDE
jgi:hypothetical protein